MKRRPQSTAARRRLIAAAAVLPIAATGCSSSGFSMASLNPFNRGEDPAAIAEVPSAGPPETPGRLAAFGGAAKDALGKTTGMFASKKDAATPTDPDDPLSLANTPTQVDPKTYVASGQLWESTGNTEKAMEAYNRALQADPNHTEAVASIARLQYRQGQYPAAAQSFQKALAQSPNDAQLHDEMGLTLQKLGRNDMAIQVMRRALQIAPKTSKYANHLASALYDNGDAAGAFQALSQNNKPAVAHFNMAYLHRKAGKATEAKQHLAEALKFEASAAGDPVVGQAVSRSRDMLAQLNAVGPATPALPTLPPATTPGLPTSPAASAIAAIQPPKATVTPASNTAPAPSLPAGMKLPGVNLPGATTPTAQVAQRPTAPAAGGMTLPAGFTFPGASTPAPTKPAAPAATAPAAPASTVPVPTTTTAPAADVDMPAWLKEALGE